MMGVFDNFNNVIKDIVSLIKKEKISYKIINQENQGAPVARNYGFLESTGEYIIFWDADTIAKPKMLQKNG